MVKKFKNYLLISKEFFLQTDNRYRTVTVWLLIIVSVHITSCNRQSNATASRGTCGDSEKIPYGKVDNCGCPTPPKAVFDRTGVSLSAGDLKIGGFAGQALKFDTSPQIVKAASEGVIDRVILDYSACRTAKQYSYNARQRNWQDMLSALLTTKPTPADIDNFYSKHPMP